ncbi:MAG: PKD domain-containing protein [Bacteroidia bacterium]|nr:PKD domain-containing protein [Bacteroidia bacterium]
MYTLTCKWLAFGTILSLLWAQSPWINWDVYADSTGNGANPVTGLTPVCRDTFWLIVDTAGMSAAGITGYRWELLNIFGASVVYEENGSSPVPYPFPPFGGISNVRKLGVEFFSTPPNGAVLLRVFYGSNERAIARPLSIKSAPLLTLVSPSPGQVLCQGSSVTFQLSVSGADSFIVSYGPTPADTFKNRLTFTQTVPSVPNWNIQVKLYACGFMYPNSYSFPTNPSSTFIALQVGPTNTFCPGSTVSFSTSSWVNLTGSTGVSLTVEDPGNNVVYTYTGTSLPASWSIPNTAVSGSYTVKLQASYPCGTTNMATAVFNVYDASTLTAPSISPNNGPYCIGTPIQLSAGGAQGLVSWDIGNDGSWDYVGSNTITHTFTSVPSGGIPIKIRQDVGCYNREDVITWNTSGPAQPTISSGGAIPANVACPGNNVLFKLYYPYNFSLSQPGNTLEWQASWLNSGNPFNGYSLDTILPAPPTTGFHMITYTITNSCGSFSSSITFSVGNPTNPPVPTVLGRACASGGTVQVIAPNESGLQSIYYLSLAGSPIGPISPGDTTTINVPSGGLSLTVEYDYGCTKGYRNLNIIPSNEPAVIQNSMITPNITCSGAPINLNVFGRYGQELRVYHGSTLLYQTALPSQSHPFFNLNANITAPSTSGTLMIVAIGCGGNDTAYHALSISGNGAVASFTTPMSACVGQPVTFQRTGNNSGIHSAIWDFGDNTTLYDTAMSVSHVYTRPGTYTIYLQIQSICGFTSMNKTIHIYAAPPTLSGISVVASGNQITYSVNATDADSVKWFFDFPNSTPSALGLSGTYTYTSSGLYTVAAIAYNGCGTDTLTQNVNVIGTNLVNPNLSSQWTLYPNPARHEIFLNHPSYVGNAQIRVYDIQGRLTHQQTIHQLPAQIWLHMPAGLYHVQIISEQGTETLRLVIE